MTIERALELLPQMRDSEWITALGQKTALYTDEAKEAFDMAIAALEQQAEDNEWCHDCKEYDQEQHCCHRFTKVIRQAVEDYRRTKHE